MATRSVVLIGFMGAGKSAVGRALAERLGYEFVDTDVMVETAAGVSIEEIFATEGEKAFRDREAKAVVEACKRGGKVIACGGGAVLELRNYRVLRVAGPIVYLRASAGTLTQRIADGPGRPLLRGKPDEVVPRLLAERAPGYEAAADVIVDTDGRAPEEVAVEIEGKLT
jgi:shikimate kinase